jgi:hypothetical protein
MVDRISLTAAEVAFLMSTRSTGTGDTGVPPTAAALGLTEADFTDAVCGAGLGSLLLRQLARPLQANQVDLATPLVAIAEGLTNPLSLVHIGLVAKEGADGSILVDAAPVRFLIAPRLFRCFDLSGVEQAIDIREPLLQIADAFVRQYQPSVATFSVPAPDGTAGTASIAVTEDGTWQVVVGVAGSADSDTDVPAPTTVAGQSEAFALLREELGRLLPVQTSAV